MLRISQYLAVAVSGAALFCGPAAAQSLMEALAATYDTNPVLAAQRAQLRATNEDLAQVRALIMPSVNADASIGRTYTEGLSIFEFGTGQPVETPIPGRSSTPKTYGLTLSQPLFDGGAFGAGRRQVRANVGREAEALRSTEQTVLLDAVAAFMDVRQAEEVVGIRISNVDVLIEQGAAASNRFEVGEVTRTDVAQAQSRLAQSRSDLIAAQGALQQQRAVFERIVGFPPATLQPPPPLPELPESLETATDIALQMNPQFSAAAFSVEAAEQAVRVARSDLLPDVTLDGALNRREDTSFAGDYTQGYSVTANVRIPLFSGGQQQSEIRQARQLARRARDELEQERRATIERTASAWAAWQASRAVVESSQSAVEARELAFEGVSREGEVGLRTTLDVLDAEQEALSARLNLVTAQRDEYVAAHQLLAAMGMMNVEYLGVPVAAYDPGAYEREVIGGFPGNLFGTSID
jgi:outer membrane protein